MPDYGCNITINNHTDWTFELNSSLINSGNWANPPPQTISGGDVRSFRPNDNFGLTGADGSCIYYKKDSNPPNVLSLSFACPVGFWNSNSANVQGPKDGYTTVNANSSGSPLNSTYHVFDSSQTMQQTADLNEKISSRREMEQRAKRKARMLEMDDDDSVYEPRKKRTLARLCCL